MLYCASLRQSNAKKAELLREGKFSLIVEYDGQRVQNYTGSESVEYVIKDVVRSVDAGDTCHVLRYRLCGERTQRGGQFLYIKCYCETWKDTQLAEEDMAVVGGTTFDRSTLLGFFRRLSSASQPVFPCHLDELVRHEEHPDSALQDPWERSPKNYLK